MGARKTGRKRGWTRIRDSIRKRKKAGCLVEGSAVFGVNSELAG
jgi:hypothetical protein